MRRLPRRSDRFAPTLPVHDAALGRVSCARQSDLGLRCVRAARSRSADGLGVGWLRASLRCGVTAGGGNGRRRCCSTLTAWCGSSTRGAAPSSAARACRRRHPAQRPGLVRLRPAVAGSQPQRLAGVDRRRPAPRRRRSRSRPGRRLRSGTRTAARSRRRCWISSAGSGRPASRSAWPPTRPPPRRRPGQARPGRRVRRGRSTPRPSASTSRPGSSSPAPAWPCAPRRRAASSSTTTTATSGGPGWPACRRSGGPARRPALPAGRPRLVAAAHSIWPLPCPRSHF